MSALHAEPARRPAAPRHASHDRRRGWLAFAAALAASATLHAAVLIALSGRARDATGMTLATLELVAPEAVVAEPRGASPAGLVREAMAPAAAHAETGAGGEPRVHAMPVEAEAEPAPRPASGAETWLSIPPAAEAAAPPDATNPVAADSFAAFAEAEAVAATVEAPDTADAVDALPARAMPVDAEAIAGIVASLAPHGVDPRPREVEAPVAQALPAAAVAPAARPSSPAAETRRAQQARRQGPRVASPSEAPPAREEPARGGDVAQPAPGAARGIDIAARPAGIGRDVPAEPAAGNPAPAYPVAARRAGREGRAVLRVVVSSTGEGREIRIAESSGTPSLDEAALAAVRHWRFTPARRNGEAAEDVVLVPVSFTLLQ